MSILSNALKQSLRAFARRGEKRADERALERAAQRFPALGALHEAAVESSRLLQAPYDEYIAGVSAPEWAVSLHTAALLHALATLLKPRTVLDDVHTPEYAPHARSCCAAAGFEVCSARALTLDAFGRYAWLAFRASGGTR